MSARFSPTTSTRRLEYNKGDYAADVALKHVGKLTKPVDNLADDMRHFFDRIPRSIWWIGAAIILILVIYWLFTHFVGQFKFYPSWAFPEGLVLQVGGARPLPRPTSSKIVIGRGVPEMLNDDTPNSINIGPSKTVIDNATDYLKKAGFKP